MLFNYIKEIQDIFGIDWPSLTWEECRKPLVSGLAARLYLHYNSRADTNGIPRDIVGQATFWQTYYRTTGNPQEYIDKSNALETGIYLLIYSYSIGF
jgi:hypothetical protein